MMNRTIPLALLLSVAAPAIASADVFDDRMARQAERIERGRQNGSITWTEGIKLRAEQTRIARTKAALASDGRLSRADRAQISEMQDVASANIRDEAHDAKHRLFGLPRVGK